MATIEELYQAFANLVSVFPINEQHELTSYLLGPTAVLSQRTPDSQPRLSISTLP